MKSGKSTSLGQYYAEQEDKAALAQYQTEKKAALERREYLALRAARDKKREEEARIATLEKIVPPSEVELYTRAPMMGATVAGAAATLSGAQEIANGLNQIPPIPGVNIPGQGTLFSALEQKALTGLTFVGSLLGLKETYDSIKKLYNAKNKSYILVGNVVVNVFRTVVTGLLIASLAGAAAYFSPILLPVSAAIGGAWALFKGIRKAYKAYKAHYETNFKKRNRLLKEAGLELISGVVNGLTAGLGFALMGVKGVLTSARNMIADGIKHWNLPEILSGLKLAQTGGQMFQGLKSTIYALGGLLTFGTVASLSESVDKDLSQAWKAISNPKKSFQSAGDALERGIDNYYQFTKKHPVLGVVLVIPKVIYEAVALVVKSALTVTKLVLGVAAKVASTIVGGIIKGVVGVAKGVFSYVKGLFADTKLALPEANPKLVGPLTNHEQLEMTRMKAELDTHDAPLKSQYIKLKEEIKKQQEKLHQKDAMHVAKATVAADVDKLMGKTFEEYQQINTEKLLANNDALNEIEKRALKTSPRAMQSFFRETSGTQSLLKRARALNFATAVQAGKRALVTDFWGKETLIPEAQKFNRAISRIRHDNRVNRRLV